MLAAIVVNSLLVPHILIKSSERKIQMNYINKVHTFHIWKNSYVTVFVILLIYLKKKKR